MMTQENIPYTADEIKAMVKTCEKYNKVLEIAREIFNSEFKPDEAMVLTKHLSMIFPELIEDEDDRIRKAIIALIEFGLEDKSAVAPGHNVIKEDAIAWLEKQGEQKSSDFSDIRTWKYIVDMVITEKDGIGQYLDNPDTERIAKRLQERYGNIEKQGENKEYVFRPVAGTMIETAVEQALNQGDVVLAFNGFYTPVKGKTIDEILKEYDHWLTKEKALAWLSKQCKECCIRGFKISSMTAKDKEELTKWLRDRGYSFRDS